MNEHDDPYDPRSTRDVPTRVDVLGRLADGVAGLGIEQRMTRSRFTS